jgi:hypothetical protein
LAASTRRCSWIVGIGQTKEVCVAAGTKIRLQGGAVRLTMSAHVANDLDGLQRSLAELAGRMGHPACATGCDTLFLQHEREFISAGEAVELNPQPIPPGRVEELFGRASRAQVNVVLPQRVSGNIKSLQKAVAVTLGKLGCAACCSGFDIAFRNELDLITINERVQAQGFGRFS